MNYGESLFHRNSLISTFYKVLRKVKFEKLNNIDKFKSGITNLINNTCLHT